MSCAVWKLLKHKLLAQKYYCKKNHMFMLQDFLGFQEIADHYFIYEYSEGSSRSICQFPCRCSLEDIMCEKERQTEWKSILWFESQQRFKIYLNEKSDFEILMSDRERDIKVYNFDFEKFVRQISAWVVGFISLNWLSQNLTDLKNAKHKVFFVLQENFTSHITYKIIFAFFSTILWQFINIPIDKISSK